jgi:transcriptional regulator of heat shock response
MELEYRESHLLKGLVEEYITTGRPVGSERLLEVLGIEVSSATIRNILRTLEEEGYITQPHTSAGRIPTDKGYRYYVDHLTFKDPSEQKVQSIQEKYVNYQEEYARPAKAVAKLLSELAHTMAFGGWLTSHDIQGAGMSLVLQDSKEAAHEASELFDSIEEYADQFATQGSNGVQVYIGSENPVFDSRFTSMLVRTVELPSGEIALLLIAGPKRMPYRRNVALLSAMASLLEQE